MERTVENAHLLSNAVWWHHAGNALEPYGRHWSRIRALMKQLKGMRYSRDGEMWCQCEEYCLGIHGILYLIPVPTYVYPGLLYGSCPSASSLVQRKCLHLSHGTTEYWHYSANGWRKVIVMNPWEWAYRHLWECALHRAKIIALGHIWCSCQWSNGSLCLSNVEVRHQSFGVREKHLWQVWANIPMGHCALEYVL